MRTIKLDDRERDLIRRSLDYLILQLGPPHPDKTGVLTKVARDWMHDELVAVRNKFEP